MEEDERVCGEMSINVSQAKQMEKLHEASQWV